VPGLRREEVALRAGISVEWYTRLERGVARGVSEEVLDAIGSALQLDEAERAHLADLVRTANAERPPRRTSTPQRVRPSIARLVDVLGPFPACVAQSCGFRALWSDDPEVVCCNTNRLSAKATMPNRHVLKLSTK
jgi:transcriptional regulator with XRE-family HTH domain